VGRTRRDRAFAGSAVGAALLLLVPVTPADAQAVRVRRSIASLTSAQLDALRTGIAAMKARAASDPTSWAYQANIHGTVDSPARAGWSTCQHGPRGEVGEAEIEGGGARGDLVIGRRRNAQSTHR
jgi:hypothetical protein